METKHNGGDLYDIADEQIYKESMLGAVDKIYTAIRKLYGYGDEGDQLMDRLDDMFDAWERLNK